jgi:hypothetical protein
MGLFGFGKEEDEKEDRVKQLITAANLAYWLGHKDLAALLLDDAEEVLEKEKKEKEEKEKEGKKIMAEDDEKKKTMLADIMKALNSVAEAIRYFTRESNEARKKADILAKTIDELEKKAKHEKIK